MSGENKQRKYSVEIQTVESQTVEIFSNGLTSLNTAILLDYNPPVDMCIFQYKYISPFTYNIFVFIIYPYISLYFSGFNGVNLSMTPM